jgi:hypothetical protein
MNVIDAEEFPLKIVNYLSDNSDLSKAGSKL